MDASDIDLLIKNGEDATLDFKHAISSAEKIAKTLVAFANTFGGKLLIGVKDNGKVLGIQPDEEQYMIEAAVAGYCRPEMKVDFEVVEYEENKNVLVVSVAKGEQTYFAKDNEGKWWAYIRVEDHTTLAGIVTLQMLRTAHKDNLIRYTEVENGLLKWLSEHETIDLKGFVKLFKLKRNMAINILVGLLKAKIIQIQYHQDKELFMAALH